MTTKLKLMIGLLAAVAGLLAVPAALGQLTQLKSLVATLAHGGRHERSTVHYDQAESPSAAEGFSLTAAPAQSSGSDFRWNGRVSAGQTVEIKGVNGGVSAEPASGGEVEVVALKSARRSDPAGVEIRVVEHQGGVTICAVYPNVDDEPNQCVPGTGGHMNVRDNDVRVEFKVRVPQGVRFNGSTVNGDVQTGALGADVEVRTVNGDIKTTSSGVVRARTVNGSISATMGGTNWSGPLEFKTVNGAINVSMPAGTNAELSAGTVNGRITTDFPLTAQGEVSRRHLSGTIGGGGRELVLKTVNGDINLRRAG